MTLLTQFSQPEQYRGGYVGIGNFDGVHRGHQALIARLRERADGVPHSSETSLSRRSPPAVVLTFDPPPITILRPERTPPRLSTVPRKAELLKRYGIDCVIAYPTTRELLSLSPREFFERIVIEQLDARGLVEGPNFYFGKDRAGTTETLQRLCDEHGLSLDVVEPEPVSSGTDSAADPVLISSSLLRGFVAEGNIARAVELMGHPYRLEGRVGSGAGRGRGLGFPTANLVDVPTLPPGPGVYAARTEIDGTLYPVAVNIGGNPTFGEHERKIEAHLIGYSGDLYDQTIAIDFLDRLRDVRPYADAEELRTQLDRDIIRAVDVVRSVS